MNGYEIIDAYLNEIFLDIDDRMSLLLPDIRDRNISVGGRDEEGVKCHIRWKILWEELQTYYDIAFFSSETTHLEHLLTFFENIQDAQKVGYITLDTSEIEPQIQDLKTKIWTEELIRCTAIFGYRLDAEKESLVEIRQYYNVHVLPLLQRIQKNDQRAMERNNPMSKVDTRCHEEEIGELVDKLTRKEEDARMSWRRWFGGGK